MDVALITNAIPGGWRPSDLDQFLGGNEESVCLLAGALSRAGHGVTVYTSIPAESITDGAVKYLPKEKFDLNRRYECLITVKNRTLWLQGAQADIKIHWMNDIEQRWSVGCQSNVDRIVILGKYMQERMPWLPADRVTMIPLGIDTRMYKPTDKPKENLAIYATSPDRGLMTLLEDWPRIRESHPGLNLFISYGWANIDKWGGAGGQQLKAQVMAAANQPGIGMGALTREQTIQLFQAAKYFIHPLNRPDSDLFGFSMLKAQECGVIPVVPQVEGCGFRETVRSYIPYRRFLSGSTEQVEFAPTWPQASSWDRLVRDYWNPLFDSLRAKEAA